MISCLFFLNGCNGEAMSEYSEKTGRWLNKLVWTVFNYFLLLTFSVIAGAVISLSGLALYKYTFVPDINYEDNPATVVLVFGFAVIVGAAAGLYMLNPFKIRCHSCCERIEVDAKLCPFCRSPQDEN